MTERIVVIRAGGLGDTLLTLPALHALRARYPAARIQAVGYPAAWEAVGPVVDEVAPIDRALFADLFAGSPSSALASWLSGADLAVAWTVQDLTPVLSASGVPQTIHATPYPPPAVHAARWLLDSLAAEPAGAMGMDLGLTAAEMAQAAALLHARDIERPVAIHPGAGAGWKRWAPERFASLTEELARRERRVVLIEGPADSGVVAQVQELVAAPFPVLRDLPLRLLAAVLAQASLYLGNDSGVTHLAAAAGARTVALFGPTDPASWAPVGKVEIVRRCRTATPKQGEIRTCQDPGCMEEIRLHEVLEAVISLHCDS